MSVETELKLNISPEYLDKLRRHALLRTLAVNRPVTHKLYSVYYDTPDLALCANAMALRLRRSGRQWLQTLKGGGSVQAGLHQRNEWEMPVAGEALDFEALKAGGGRLPRGVRKQLQPVFVTDFSRSARLLHFEGAVIELCLDSGEVRAGKKKHSISELELELKSGGPQQLFKLALALFDTVPLEVEHTSKAEYGYQLYSGGRPLVVKASFPRLEQSHGIASALQSMVASCLLHVQANVSGAIHKLDEEYLHQVRVGLRRLRVVLAMAEAFCADEELRRLHEEVAEMCIEFGRMREWDVFITQTLAPVCARLPQHAGLRSVMAASEKLRARHHADVVHRLQSPDYQRLLLRFGAWMYGDYWRQATAGTEPGLRDFAIVILQKRSRQVERRGRHVASADAARLHLLRIACKKLRYSAEMFGSLFPEGKPGQYVAALSGLQDILGVLNDLAVAQRLLEEMKDGVPHDALDLIRGWMEHERATQKAKLATAWKRFSGRKTFWDRAG
jgi:inorganic triphosphatase YgiF